MIAAVKSPTIGRRVIVVGCTGSGKTTLARRISGMYRIPHVELDALHWGPDWTPVPDEVFTQRVSAELAAERWVADGNYSKVRDVTWRRADMLVWLDFNLPLIIWRLFHRSLRRIIARERLWSDNRESWRNLFFSRDSLFLWALKSRPRHHRDYPMFFKQPKYSHLSVVRLRSPSALRNWLKGLPDENALVMEKANYGALNGPDSG